MNLDHKLRRALCQHPHKFNTRYTQDAQDALLETLFRSLTNDRPRNLSLLFPNGFPDSYRLQDAQQVDQLAEYNAAARGTPCGHIFKQGEVTYHCSTCTDDPTAVLCARCFASSSHDGHQLHISISSGNSGCCDCGDDEAWKRPVNCAIHTAADDFVSTEEYVSTLPQDLQDAIRITISRVLDYFCDVISCSPENLRVPKTIDSVLQDELDSRLKSDDYGQDDEEDSTPEFCLLIWNDEKHTIREVQHQVARACRERLKFGLAKADETNDYGRSVVRHSRDLKELTRMAKVIEEIKITVTIRSSRDTFREQMCGTIIEWLSDIAGGTIGNDSHILRRTICEEMLQLWRMGSLAWNAEIGREQLDVHGTEDSEADLKMTHLRFNDPIQMVLQRAMNQNIQGDDDLSEGGNDLTDMVEVEDVGDDMDDEEDDHPMANTILQTTTFQVDHRARSATETTLDADATDDADEMDTDGDNDFLDIGERIEGDQLSPPAIPEPPAPFPAATPTPAHRPPHHHQLNPDRNPNFMNLGKPAATTPRITPDGPPPHWILPRKVRGSPILPLYEDLSKNVRIDSMILFDLRLWKIARTSLRDLYISTVVKVPHFKRILGLRFSGLYTSLAQLFLLADREPDHSIVNLSLQILTTPSICQEVIEKGNFLTNLMAILYTFLTTKKVGYPQEVDPGATLAFDAGSVANRRLYHFFSDLRYFLASSFVQSKVRADSRYLTQYLDLVKLLQGICPNVRAIGEHVEYETDAWISAALLTREVNKLCRQFAETFQINQTSSQEDKNASSNAIAWAAAIATVNSFGLERKRFEQSEIKDIVRFHVAHHHANIRVVDFSVEKGSLSFHHPLHYTLSWLLEGGKQSKASIEALRVAARQVIEQISEAPLGPRDALIKTTIQSEEDALMVLFDYPLRVCAWLAQMKANMWVRNGMSLRHQMGQYRSVPYRDVAHQRDLFLLQTSLVACDPGRVLISMIDRFGLTDWMSGTFASLPDCEDGQMLDLAEDLIYLLINLLSDRDGLTSGQEDSESFLAVVRKEIAHSLCFKSLSYTDLTARLTERVQDHEKLQDVLETMTRFRPPEGMHDSGLYELKEEYLSELDPYNSHFSKNQRDEAENIYKKWMGKKLKKDPEDVVLEPKLRSITSEAYEGLAAVVHTPAFIEMIYRTLVFVADGHRSKTNVTVTRVENSLQIVLQLTLIATLEDSTLENQFGLSGERPSFVHNALSTSFYDGGTYPKTVVRVIHKIWMMDDFSACRSKIKHLLRLFNQKRPSQFADGTLGLEFPSGRFDTASPANLEVELEAKKKQALDRKSKVMAQFQQQQQNFIRTSGFDWEDEELATPDAELPASTESRAWKYPSGLCIQCREETTDSRLYGTFAMITDGHVLRETPAEDPDFVNELAAAPGDLDRSIEEQRPFGVAGWNREYVSQMTSDGQEIKVERQGLSKGWPLGCTKKGPLTTSCGHIMHFACYENYYQSVHRRHSQQVARNHPERVALKEFVCPLCKALANAFLPIVWKSTEQAYPGSLETHQSFLEFLDTDLQHLRHNIAPQQESTNREATSVHRHALSTFSNTSLAPAIEMSQASGLTISQTTSAWAERPELAPFTELASVYLRLKDPLAIIARTVQPTMYPPGIAVNHFYLLLETLANTIAATETAYRGREAEFGTSLLSGIPQQTLSHLQILSATIRSYSATCAVTVRGTVEEQYHEVYQMLYRQLLGQSVSSDGVESDAETDGVTPLLQTDSFSFMTQATMLLCPMKDLELRHVLRLALSAELLRVVLHYSLNSSGFLQAVSQSQGRPMLEPTSQELNSLEQALLWTESRIAAMNKRRVSNMHLFDMFKQSLNTAGAAFLLKVLKTYALAFMRKAAVFFHVAHGVDYPTTAGSEASLPELDRLLHFLQLPPIAEILGDFSEFSPSASFRATAAAWFADWDRYGLRDPDHRHAVSKDPKPANGIRLLHPAPLELIGLPKYYDVLIELSSRKKCPTTGKELSDPALCLFCGEIFCSQTVCCMTRQGRGGCNAHVEKCSSPIGMFLFIRKCHVVLLHVVKDPKMLEINTERQSRGLSSLLPGQLTLSHGSFFPAPYMTRHGETDSGLRSKQVLGLNEKRYEKGLRDTWLCVGQGNGGVWSAVARRLEGEVNAGGWETL